MTPSTTLTLLPENSGGAQARTSKSNQPIYSGNTVIVSDCVISGGFGITDSSGGVIMMKILDGGSAVHIHQSDGYGLAVINVSSGGRISGATLYYDTILEVYNGGIAENITLKDFSAITVFSGGYASRVVNDDNTFSLDINVLSEGYICDVTCGVGRFSIYGTAMNNRIYRACQQVYESGLAVSNFIESGGSQTISGGTVVSTIVSSGGKQDIGGGLASSSIIMSGGSQIFTGGMQRDTVIMSGATASGSTLSATALTLFGNLYGTNRNMLSGVIIAGGNMILSSAMGSNISDVVITSGGVMRVVGFLPNAWINHISGVEINDGALHLGQGVSATAIVVNSGQLSIASGAMIYALTVATGGCVSLASGAVLQGPVTFTPTKPTTGEAAIDVSGSTLPSVVWQCDLTGRIVTGVYTLINSTSLNQLTLLLPSGTASVNKTTPYSIIETNRRLDFTLKNVNGATALDIYGQYKLLYGWQSGADYTLSAVNCRIVNGLYGTESGVAVTGNVNSVISLSGTKNTGNIYCGGLNNTIAGNVNAAITGGTYSGTIYGGTFSGTSNNTTGGSINLTVSGVVHQHNTAVTTGITNWLLGGGSAKSGETGTVSGGISLAISNSQLGYVVGGGSASGSGSVMTVGGASTTITGCTVTGNIYAGGYADSSGISHVAGNASLLIDVSSSATTITGNIFGGGKYDATCNADVTGASEIIFSGSGTLLTFSGTVKGGNVSGERRLKLTDYIGDFSGIVSEMDSLIFSGDTTAVFDYMFSCEKLVFDLTGRSLSVAGDAMLRVTEGFAFNDNTLEVIFDPASMGLGQTRTFELIGLDAEIPDILSIQILNSSGTVLASMAFGETATSGLFSYEVERSVGGIAFSCMMH